MNQYFLQDVKTIVDAELSSLILELEEASCVHDDERCWGDGESEDRYYSLCAEQSRRRWEVLTPEQRVAQREAMSHWQEWALRALQKSVVASRSLNRDYASQFGSKIGDAITIRKPQTYIGSRS